MTNAKEDQLDEQVGFTVVQYKARRTDIKLQNTEGCSDREQFILYLSPWVLKLTMNHPKSGSDREQSVLYLSPLFSLQASELGWLG